MFAAAHLAFDLRDSSQVGQFRRAAIRQAELIGFDALATGRVALVATELGNNLVRYAQHGRLLLNGVGSKGCAACLEIISIDSGPGIADLEASSQDGYSTGGTPGTGLGAVRRMSSEFDAFSMAARGTVIWSRITSQPGAKPGAGEFQVGGVALCATGETVCGDAWGAVENGSVASLLVADGLGHGPEASEAAQAAVSEFAAASADSPSRILELVHQRLKPTRGAAVALARLDRNDNSLLFSGIGNIVGRLLSGVDDRTMMSQHGTAGVQIRSLRDMRYDWPDHALLVMHSDGLVTRWNLADAPGLLRRHPTVVAAWLLRDHRRGADDVTVVVLKRSEAR